jgi:hypothetical protein
MLLRSNMPPRPFQFRLRELFYLMASCAVFFGLLQYQLAIALGFLFAATALAVVVRRVRFWLNLSIVLGSAAVISGGIAIDLLAVQISKWGGNWIDLAELLFLVATFPVIVAAVVFVGSCCFLAVCLLVLATEGEAGLREEMHIH